MRCNEERKIMTYEELEKVLKSHSNIKDLVPSNMCPLDELFNRNFHFKIFNKQYKITWFHNMCALYIDEIEIFFNDVIIAGTWPNNAKINLQFYNIYNDSPIAILPIEYYANR